MLRKIFIVLTICIGSLSVYGRDYAKELVNYLSGNYGYVLRGTAPATYQHGLMYVLNTSYNTYYLNKDYFVKCIKGSILYTYCQPLEQFSISNGTYMIATVLGVRGTTKHIVVMIKDKYLTITDTYEYSCKHY